MKKCGLFIIILTLLLITGCSKNNRDYLIFYVWGDSVEVSWYEKIADDFYNETGKVVKVQPATGDYYENLNIYLGSKKNAPDIFFTEQGEILSQISSNRLLNLSPYIDSKALDVKQSTNENGKIQLWDINDVYRYNGERFGNGDYYAFIKDWTPDFILWYNKDHIDKYNQENCLKEGDEGFMEYPSETIPMTWDQFLDMSYKLTNLINDNQYGTMLDRVPWKHVFEWIQMTGSEPFIDGKYFNVKDEGVYKAFEFFSKLQKGEKASAPIIGPTGIGSGEAFANGNLSFAWFGSWAYSAYNFENVSFNIGIAPPPVPAKDKPLTEEDNYGVSAGMIALAINNDTPLKDEAISFLNYYMTKGSEYMATKGFNIPGNQLVAQSDIYTNPEDSFLKYMNNYFLNYALDYTHPIEYNQYISQIMVESQLSKHFSTWFNNYNPNDLNKVLNKIENDIKNEID